MDWVQSKAFGLVCGEFADVFVRGETFEGFESPGEVVGCDEVVDVRRELAAVVVVVALDGRLFDGSVHALYLAVGPGMVGLGESMFDAMLQADAVEGMPSEPGGWSFAVLGQIGELDSVIGQHGVDAIRDRCKQCFQEGRSGAHVSTLDQFDDGELRSTVDGYEEIEPSFGGAHLGQIDVEVPNRIVFELLPLGLAAFHFGQATDAMPLQTAMQRRSGELRDRGF